jgi:peptide/nickel transport system substrate-binding protein
MRRRSFLASGAATLAMPRIALAQGSRVLKFIPYLIFDTLYGWTSKFEATPQMVEGYTVDADGLTWTLKLRDGLHFHDGEKVLARDCVASLRRWGKRDNCGRMLMAATAELSAPDDRSIVFRLRTPFPQLPEALGQATNNSAAIMPERLAMTDPFKQVTELVGSGPFRFKADERISGAKYI